VTLALNLENPISLSRILLGYPGTLSFRSGFKLKVLRPLDLLVAAEVILLDCYKLRDSTAPTTVIDVGGALGEFGLFVAQRFPDAKVTIFEPNPTAFALLEENAALNKISNASLQWSCIGPETSYDFPADHSAQNSILGASAGRAKVPGAKLESFIDEHVDILKIDTEGFEIPVLTSGGERLKRVRQVWLEYHENIVPGQRAALEQLLRQAGFVVTTVPDPYERTLGLMFATNQRIL
jgi:FkbM family methyltransferase